MLGMREQLIDKKGVNDTYILGIGPDIFQMHDTYSGVFSKFSNVVYPAPLYVQAIITPV